MQMAKLQLSVRLILLVAAVCVVFLVIGGSAEAEGPPLPPTEYVVESGDTLWGIASSHGAPGADLRRLVADISRMSGIEAGSIFPGQVLQIPTG